MGAPVAGNALQNNLDHILYKIAEFVTMKHPLVKDVRISQTLGQGRPKSRDSMADELRVIKAERSVLG